MKNGDKAAIPFQPCGPDGLPSYEAEFGLTKRETMAMHILPSLIEAYEVDQVATQGESVVRDAVIYADLLLAELERTGQ